MMRSCTRFVAASAVALVLVGCSAGTSLEPSTAASLASVEASVEASQTAEPVDSGEGSRDLEALIPDEIGGVEVTKSSGSVAGFVEGGEGEPALLSSLGTLVEEAPDADLAVGFAFGEEVQSNLWIFRAPDVAAENLVQSIREAFEAEDSLTGWEASMLAGKDVLVAVDPGEEGTEGSDQGRAYLYGTDSMVFFFTTTDPEVAAEVFEALP